MVEELLAQIDAATHRRGYYLALVGALTVPDIAGALGHRSGEASAERYESWVRDNLETWSGGDLPRALYQYRCSILHQHRAQPDRRKKVPRLLFREPPGSPGFVVHNVTVSGDGDGSDGATLIDVREFCREVTAAARAWMQGHLEDPVVLINQTRSIRRHPHGMPPYFGGFPVIG